MYEGLSQHNKTELEAFVDVVLGTSFALSIHDGDSEWSRPSQERETLLGLLGNMDSDSVRLYYGLTRVGWFWLVYGNEPGVLLADHTDNPVCEAIWNAWRAKVGAE